MVTTKKMWEEKLLRYMEVDRFEELIQVMLDIAAPPLYISHSGGMLGRIVPEAIAQVSQALATETHAEIDRIRSELPLHLRDVDLALALLEVGTHERYFEIPDSVYDPPAVDSRVLQRLPSLQESIDDDGLVDCVGLRPRERELVVGHDAVQYHQFLRRGYHSNINDTLLRVLVSVGTRVGNHLRLAIDDRRIADVSDLLHIVEEDYWYGPHLTEEWLDDPHAVGRTVHEDPEGEDCLRGYWKFLAYWRMDGEGQKVVQMEEVVGEMEGKVGQYRLLRYLHAIRDIEQHHFVHCDGAVRAYDSQAFEERKHEEMPPSVPANRYRKLFRLDGEITTQEWSDIVAKWFRHNILAREYLTIMADTAED
jgi:hypothetical protein